MAKKYENIKVGKNQIHWDGEVWVVEVFEFEDNGTPMYSVVDTYKEKSKAMKVARLVNRNNTSRIIERYSD